MNAATQFPPLPNHDDEPRFRALFEGAAIGIAICRLDGRILETNPSLSRMLGYSSQELADTDIGALYPEFFFGMHSGLHSEIGRRSNSADLLLGRQSLEALMRGERDWIEVEQRCRRKDGSELCGCLTLSLGRDVHFQPAFLIAMLADATERKRMEEHLREAEKMEVIGRLAGGIAHDFNNLLTGILLYCDLLSAELNGDGVKSGPHVDCDLATPKRERSNLCRHVDEVRMAGEQGAALTRQLLAIARKQAAEPRPVRIDKIIASTENLLRRLIGEQIELRVATDPALASAMDSGAGLVLADPMQIKQVLLNLVLNARDAMPRGGKIILSTRLAQCRSRQWQGPFPDNGPHEFRDDSPRNSACHSESGGSQCGVSLIIKDNGCGMNAETRARLFEPFFTTKNPGKGTGLGLATVQRIVSEAGGNIKVKSEEGHGTCVEVFFPQVRSQTETLRASD